MPASTRSDGLPPQPISDPASHRNGPQGDRRYLTEQDSENETWIVKLTLD